MVLAVPNIVTSTVLWILNDTALRTSNLVVMMLFLCYACREMEKLLILQHSIVFSSATIVPNSGPFKCHIISHLLAITCIVFFMHLIYILVEILTAQVVDTKTRMTHSLLENTPYRNFAVTVKCGIFICNVMWIWWKVMGVVIKFLFCKIWMEIKHYVFPLYKVFLNRSTVGLYQVIDIYVQKLYISYRCFL